MRKNLSKSERLRSSFDFKRVFANPGKVTVPGAKLLFLANEFSFSRFGLSVSRRFGKAVDRNRIKRQFREIIRHNKELILDGFDLVIVPFDGQYTYGDREKQFLHLIRRASLENESHETPN